MTTNPEAKQRAELLVATAASLIVLVGLVVAVLGGGVAVAGTLYRHGANTLEALGGAVAVASFVAVLFSAATLKRLNRTS